MNIGAKLRRVYRLGGALVVGWLLGSTPARGADATLDTVVQYVMSKAGIPGLQAVVIKHGRITWAKSYGYAVLEEPGPKKLMRNESILLSASVVKMWVAVAVMQQVETGRLALDDDIDRSLPFSVRNPRWPEVPITWRMLLSHTSSLNSEDDARLWETTVFGEDSTVTLEEVARSDFAPDGRRRWANQFRPGKPGTERIYSNDGYVLAAYALQRVMQQPFDQYVDERILRPLRMAHSGYWLAGRSMDHFAVGYASLRQKGGGYQYSPARAYWWHGDAGGNVKDHQPTCSDYPAGCAHINALDLARFMLMLMNGGSLEGKKILDRKSVDLMATPTGLRNLDGWNQGLGFNGPEDTKGRQVWGHDGEDRGAANAFYFNPKTGLGAIVFANGMDSDYSTTYAVDDLAMHLMAWFE